MRPVHIVLKKHMDCESYLGHVIRIATNAFKRPCVWQFCMMYTRDQLTFAEQTLVLPTPKSNVFENFLEKGENLGQDFLFFPTMFSLLCFFPFSYSVFFSFKNTGIV